MSEEIRECQLQSEKRWSAVDARLVKIEEQMTTVFQSIKSQNSVIKDLQELNKSVSVLAVNMQMLLEEQKSQNESIATLENKPAKRWDSIVDKILMTIIVALVTMVLVRLGIQ